MQGKRREVVLGLGEGREVSYIGQCKHPIRGDMGLYHVFTEQDRQMTKTS